MEKLHDDDDFQSLHSLDLEEAKAMLSKNPELMTYTEPTRRSRLRSCCIPISFILNAFLFVSTLIILHNPCSFSSRECQYNSQQTQIIGEESESNGPKLMSEEHGFVPEFSLEKVTFMNDSRYSTIDMFENAHKYDRILKQWEGDMPLGRGFVKIKEEALTYLPRPYTLRANPSAYGYSIASLHQYHCLYMILRGYGDTKLDRPSHDPDHERHVTHCFDYLRQSIFCAGDNALEGKSDTVERMTDGWGNVHVCKKRTEWMQWVFDNRLTNYTGIH